LLRPVLTRAADFHCSAGNAACLVAAINSANATLESDTILLDAGTYALTAVNNDTDGPNGLPSITGSLSIRGHAPGDTFIQRGTAPPSQSMDPYPLFRLIHVSAAGTVVLDSLTVRYASTDEAIDGTGVLNRGTLHISNSIVTGNLKRNNGHGAGIANYGTLTVTDTTIIDNQADGIGGAGGGIFSDGDVTVSRSLVGGYPGGMIVHGHATISNSTIGGTADGCGGAMGINTDSTVEIADSLVGGGSYDSGGGGICNFGITTITNTTIVGTAIGANGGAIWNFGTLMLSSSTISDSVSDGGGGIANAASGTVSLKNTVVARNRVWAEFEPGPDCLGSITSLGNNFIGDPTGCTIALQTTDKTGDPGLGGLINNGTPGGGHATPLAGSPLIDAGDPGACPAADLFGRPRNDGNGDGTVVCDIGAVEFQPLVPFSLDVNPPSGGGSSGNGVLEPNETVLVRPAWKNLADFSVSSGAKANLTGPADATYALLNATAQYTIEPGATGACASVSDCYEVSMSTMGTRPATHWDSQLTETIDSFGAPEVWTLHVGESFTDVPRSYLFYKPIETVLHNGLALGCTATTFCPSDLVRRDQMAVFLARAVRGGAANIPVSGTAPSGGAYDCTAGGKSLFSDVAPTDSTCRAIHLMSGAMAEGCGTGLFCVTQPVSRGNMSLFVGRAAFSRLFYSDGPLAYGPDSVTGRSYSCEAGSPSLHFTDVKTSDSFCRYAHYLWAKGLIAGCGPNLFCPSGLVTRGEMAKLLTNAFGLKLYKP
jgi:hypothetical protein